MSKRVELANLISQAESAGVNYPPQDAETAKRMLENGLKQNNSIIARLGAAFLGLFMTPKYNPQKHDRIEGHGISNQRGAKNNNNSRAKLSPRSPWDQ